MTFNLENELSPILHNQTALIQYLRSKGILKSIVFCDGCGNILKRVKYKKTRTKKLLSVI